MPATTPQTPPTLPTLPMAEAGGRPSRAVLFELCQAMKWKPPSFSRSAEGFWTVEIVTLGAGAHGRPIDIPSRKRRRTDGRLTFLSASTARDTNSQRKRGWEAAAQEAVKYFTAAHAHTPTASGVDG